MKETEKLVNEGFVTPDFFNQEVRSDYLVSSDIKKMWAIQMDLSRQLINICKKHDLQVWGLAGTVLGAVRHHGFIPWDDDMDFIMPREDFEKLMTLSNEFAAPYFLQSPYDRKEVHYTPFARLRNSNTYLNHHVCPTERITWNSGIFIDIFPLDGICSSGLILRIRYAFIKLYTSILHCYVLNINPHWCMKALHKVLHWPVLKCTHDKINRHIHKLASRTDYGKAQRVGLLVSGVYNLDHFIFEKTDWQDTVVIPFEQMLLPVPVGYEHTLRTMYGDYMAFPPLEKRGTWHHFTIDPDRTYLDYIANKKV